MTRQSKAHKRILIVIYVSGGAVQGVLSDTPAVETMIVDYDNERAGEPTTSRAFKPVQVDRDCIEKTSRGVED